MMQTLFQGEGSLSKLIKSVSEKGINNLFIITGKHFTRENDLSFLNNIQHSHYIKQGANVSSIEVKDAFDEFNRNNSQAILAIGGGSVIDLAKMILWNCIQQHKPTPLLLVAPTTTGSGSEATQFAVVYEQKKKKSISHPSLLPAFVALDPQLIYSLSNYQAAVSGMDALSQAVESYWSRAATNESKQLAALCINLWNVNFIDSLLQNSKEAKTQMQLAAYHAGQAINITRTTGPHALSYYLTAEYNIPHGQAVALFLPAFFFYNNPATELCRLFGANSNEECASLIKDKMKAAGLALNLAELGIDKSKIVEKLLDEVNEERFSNNPVSFNHGLLKNLISEYL